MSLTLERRYFHIKFPHTHAEPLEYIICYCASFCPLCVVVWSTCLPSLFLTPAGDEHREADCLHQHTEWQRGRRLPPGHSASRPKSGWCPAVLTHPGRRGRCSVGPGCQWLWVWSRSQRRPRAGLGKRAGKDDSSQLYVYAHLVVLFFCYCIFLGHYAMCPNVVNY